MPHNSEPFCCPPITDDPDAVDVMDLKIGHGTVNHTDHLKDNETRASWGLVAVRAYTHRIRAYGEPPETILNALISDIRHLCDVLGLAFTDVIDGSYNHYDHEIRGE
jgi:hypothetical protein